VTGTCNLISRGGTCRLLRTDISQALQAKAGAGTLVAAGLGALLGSRSSEKDPDGGKLDGAARMAMEMAEYLGKIPFDQLTISAVRDESRDLRVQEFSLISPMLRITGTGSIAHREGVPFLEQPLELRLQLSTRDRLGEWFGKAGLSGDRQDNLGYQMMARELRLGGSLSAPDTSDLKASLVRFALSKTTDDFLRKLLGR
jgi:hypothetical protein